MKLEVTGKNNTNMKLAKACMTHVVVKERK